MPQLLSRSPFRSFADATARIVGMPLVSLLCLLVLLTVTPVRGLAEEPLHVHLISGSKEYKSEPSLKAWAEQLEARGVEVTASWGSDGGKSLPNLEPLKDADLMVVFARRNNLPPEQLALVKGHWEAGKPVIGIRTASHAFDRETNKVWDHEILGGAYDGHLGDEEVEVTTLDGVKSPVLAGVKDWTRQGKLYKNDADKMPETATVLLYGKGKKSGKTYPVAWINRWPVGQGEGRAFSTSMGLPSDFENPQFQRLMLNAVDWTTGRELEEAEDAEEGAATRPADGDTPQAASEPQAKMRIERWESAGGPERAGDGIRTFASGSGAAWTSVAQMQRVAAAQMPGEDPAVREMDETDDRGPLPEGDPNPDPEDATGVEVDLPERPGHFATEMDYGPAIASSLDFGKDDTLDRALTVRVPGGAVVYDPDRMRVAAAWKVGEGKEYLDLSKTHHKSMKGSENASPGGEPQFRTADGPGWAKPQGVDAKAPEHGPLPKAWIDYHGQYMHGNRLALAYSVGGREVIESPASQQLGEEMVFARDFHVEDGDSPITLQLPLASGSGPLKIAFWKGNQPVKLDAGQSLDAAGVVAVADTDVASSALLAAVQGAPAGAAWSVEANNLRLTIPASGTPFVFRLFMHGGDADFHDEMLALASRRIAVPDPKAITQPGPRRWLETVKTTGNLGKPQWGYAADEIKLPESNPYGSWVQVAAMDFLPDGRLILSTLNGDVWLVSGLDDTLKDVKWQRFATGLYEPLGVHVRDGAIYVSGRDRITRLHDLNSDGEADFYESFYDGGTTSPGYHAFTFGVASDTEGNFYIAKSGRKVAIARPDYNCVVRISPDGTSGEPIAWGFRHPNGLAMSPDDELFVSDNQGEWVPCGKQSLVRPGKFYGYAETENKAQTKGSVFERFKPKDYVEPLFYIDHDEDNSSGQAAWADPQRWGPLSGNMLHTTYGKCQMFYVMRGEGNAAVVPMPWTFKSGIMRAATNPADGSVFIGGLKGWDTRAVEDASLSRVRYTGEEATLLTGFDVAADTVTLRFNKPLDSKIAADASNYDVLAWSYRYWRKYGSPEYNPKTGERGKLRMDPQPQVAADGKSVTLRLPGLMPVDQLRIAFTLKDAGGKEVEQRAYLTLHKVGDQVRTRGEDGL